MRLRVALDQRGFGSGGLKRIAFSGLLSAGIAAGNPILAAAIRTPFPLFKIGYFFLFSLLEVNIIMVQLGRPLLRKYRNVRVVIRMSLGGCTNRPFYRIVAAHNRRARDGKYLEQIGCYDPLPNSHGEKIMGLNFDRFKYWFAYGATPTKPLEKLLGLAGFLPLHPMTVTNAERFRKKKAQEPEKAAENEEGEKEDLDEKQEQQQQQQN